MTTIAYRNGELAGDTRVTAAETIMPERERKVFRFPNGFLFGAAGASDEIEKLMQSVKRSLKTPKLPECDGLMVDPDGKVFWYEGSHWQPLKAPFAAIGSGKSYALGALYYGASALEAVKIGCKLDVHSGVPIHIVRLKK